MLIKEVKFTGSFPGFMTCPEPSLPEYAFIGRSNVGKSSLINMLGGKTGLAHVSQKPGKTRMINFFLVNNSWYMVDLPGYGYANQAKSVRSGFGRMIEDYLLKRPNMQCAFILIDINVPAQKHDIDFFNWIGENEIPCAIVFTKVDKLKRAVVETQRLAICNEIGELWHELPQIFLTSSNSQMGKKEILDFIEKINDDFR